jgi:AhpD family alkylhydroperoxidase
MSRIDVISLATPADAELTSGDRVNRSVGGIMMHRPEAAAALGGFTSALKTSGTFSPRLAELIRLRIAFHNQCRSCMAIRYSDAVDDGLTEALVCSLEKPQEAQDLTDRERVALRFADLFATNHLAIDEAMYADLREHFDEGEIVELGMWCAMDVGFGRLAATWHVVEDLPEEFQVEGQVTPWGQPGLTTS